MRELSLHILDVVQNSISAGASKIEIGVIADSAADRLLIRIRDNGHGMEPQMAARITDPFVTTRTTRRVGLGVPMLAAAAEACGGGFRVRSQPGEGTVVEAEFGLRHIDREPLGDIAMTLVTVIAANPEIAFTYEHTVDGRSFLLDTEEIRRQLDGFPIGDGAVLRWIQGYVSEGVESVGKLS